MAAPPKPSSTAPGPPTALLLLSLTFGTIVSGFGINALLNPKSGLDFFGFDLSPSSPTSAIAAQTPLVEKLMLVYGARDLFMGFAIYAAAYFKEKRTLGALLLLIGAVAGVDGYAVMLQGGDGRWNHWEYAPVVAGTGVAVLLG